MFLVEDKATPFDLVIKDSQFVRSCFELSAGPICHILLGEKCLGGHWDGFVVESQDFFLSHAIREFGCGNISIVALHAWSLYLPSDLYIAFE